MSESRGRSSETFFRLCSRAPRTMRRSATPVRTFLERSDRGEAPVFSDGGAPVLFRLGGATDSAGLVSLVHNNSGLSSMPDAAPDHIARAFDLRGWSTTFTQTCGGVIVDSMNDHVRDLASVRDAT